MRVFVAEDEFLVAVQLEEDLRAVGFSVIGPFGTLDSAMQAARHVQPDVAVLDVNLNGDMVFPLADELLKRSIPVVLVSGYLPTDLPERFRRVPHISKPYDPAALGELLGRLGASGPG
jgi:two-component system, response regulator PdtaR